MVRKTGGLPPDGNSYVRRGKKTAAMIDPWDKVKGPKTKQYSFGLLRAFGVGYNQGGLIRDGKRTLSGAEADRRFNQQEKAVGNNPSYKLQMGLAQSTSGGIRRIEPSYVSQSPIFENGKMNPGILKSKKSPVSKTKSKTLKGQTRGR